MNVTREKDPATGLMVLWEYEWEGSVGSRSKKLVRKLGIEPPPSRNQLDATEEIRAICWTYGGTMGNIAVYSEDVLGSFPDADEGNDAQLPCNIIEAGKFRNGANRYWCTVHQEHWGKKADIEDLKQNGVVRCPNSAIPMSYVKRPFQVDLREHAEFGIWCSMPPALSSEDITPRPPKIHVHSREIEGGSKQVDKDYSAIAVIHTGETDLFGANINRINITPPAVFEYVDALERGQKMVPVDCTHCGFPHLDLGSFAREPHRKHACGNCGRDSTWTSDYVISNPLQRLHDAYTQNKAYQKAEQELDLDQYKHMTYQVWASTPAVVWTADRPQETGIHVHVLDGEEEIVNDTFGQVIFNGKPLDREHLYSKMKNHTHI
jgi:hypothetical protein